MVPVDARIDVPHQLAPHVETAVYFVVAEALTNVAKHSGATSASVSVAAGGTARSRCGSRTTASAARTPPRASGLAGLGQRLAAVDGTLDVTSPEGGPTVVLARIPLASRMRVVVADDSLLLREGLQLLLAEAGHEVVGSVGDGPSFVAAMLEHRPDIGVVDVRMPPSHTDEGLRAAVDVRRAWPDAPADGPLAVRRGVVRRRPARGRATAASATCSRTGSATSTTSSARWPRSRPAAPCSTRWSCAS